MNGLRLHSQSVERLPVMGRVLTALGAFLLFAGVAGGLVSATGFELPPAVVIIAAMCAAVIVVVGALVAGKGRTEITVYAGIAAILLVACVALGSSFVGGGAQLVNAALVRIGERTQMYALPYKAGGETDLVLFCAITASVIALTASVLLQRGYAVPCLALAFIALAVAALGWVPVGWWVVALAAAIVCCLCVRTAFSGQGVTPFSLPFMLAGTLVAGLLCFGGAAAVLGGSVDGAGQPAAVSSALWRLQYGNAHFAMPEGNLNDLGPLADSDQEAMRVTTDSPTREYLRGFVGERYDDGVWNPLTSNEIMENRSLFYWLDVDGFRNSSQLADVSSISEFGDAEPASLTEEFRAVRKPYAYLPYGYELGSSALSVTDMSQMRLENATRQTLSFDAGVVRNAYLLQDMIDKKQVKADTYEGGTIKNTPVTGAASKDEESSSQPIDKLQALRVYLDDNQAYRQFTESAYLTVPDDVANVFKGLYGAPTKLTCEQAKIHVQGLLDDTVAYSDDAETANGDQDFVEYFLTEAHEGYSVHYATAATLLMRYYGVPARYVEGYVLDTPILDKKAEEAKSEDATSGDAVDDEGQRKSESSKASEEQSEEDTVKTYTLTEHEAHAWVEYYLDGVGWIPFDVTPGWRDAGFYHTTKNSQLVDESQNWSVGEASDDAVWTPPSESEEETDAEEEQPPSPIFAELDFPPMSWPWAIAGFILALIVAFFIRDEILHRRLDRFLAQANDPAVPARQAVTELFSYLVLLLRVCGDVDLQNIPYAEQDLLIRESHLCSAAYFERAAKANDKALFAGENADIGQDDVNAVMECINSVYRNLGWNSGKLDLFWQKHVKCLW